MAFTYFFRDAQTLDVALDQAMENLQGQVVIHVWDAGCAHGPEPYTLAILLRERMSEFLFRNVTIHATDVDEHFAASVGSGVFPEAELRRVPPELVARYCRPADKPGFVEMKPELRARIRFHHHDLLSLEPIHEGISLVVCKNVLLHFDEAQRAKVLRTFYQALRPDGLLVLEHTQKLPEEMRPFFEQAAPHAQVFRKCPRVACVRHHSPDSGHPTYHWTGCRDGHSVPVSNRLSSLSSAGK